MAASPPREKTPPVDLVDNRRFLHGRLDPAREESYGLVEALDIQPQVKATEMRSQWAFDEGSPRCQVPPARTLHILLAPLGAERR